MSQAKRTRYFAQSATRARSARRGKEKNKALKALFFFFPRLALRARVALRAKYRVRPAWLIKRLSCRLIIIKVLRQTQIKISALTIYGKDCHTTLSVPSLFGHGALYRFFLVLWKLLLVSYCVVVWVLFGVFSCFCITSFGDCTCPQHQETAHYKVWNLP